MPTTASTTTVVECGSARTASSPWRSSHELLSDLAAPASTGTTIAELPGRQRRDRELAHRRAGATGARRLVVDRRPGAGAAGRAQLLDGLRRRAPAARSRRPSARARLDVDREHAEQPLQRALVDVQRLDPRPAGRRCPSCDSSAGVVVDRRRSPMRTRRGSDQPPVTAIARPIPP